MAGYVLVRLEVTDPAGFESYRRVVRSLIEQSGGQYIIRGGEPQVLEGEPDPRRLIAIRFPSVAQAKAWWDSEAYREPKAIRQRTANTDLIIVEGLPDAPEHEASNPPAYMLAEVEVTDPAGFDVYRGMVPATFSRFGGRYVIRGGEVQRLEGSWNPTRLVLVQFASTEQALAWWASPEYAEAKALRQRSANTSLQVLRGA